MVNIPIKLYKAVDESSSVSLCNTHKECGAAVREQKICPECNKVLYEASELQKAYPEDHKKLHCIPLTDEEIAGIPIPSAHQVVVDGFIEAIPDLRYPSTVYVAEPDEGGERAFDLFEEVLAQGLIAISKITIASKEHLVAIRTSSDGLIWLQLLHWTADLRDTSSLRRPKAQVSEKEFKIAMMLADTLPKNIDLAPYKNEYGAALKELIANKKAGVTLQQQPQAAPTREVDLVEQLMASLKQAEAVLSAETFSRATHSLVDPEV
jgi:DNA end-binding protein Ku